MSETHVASSNGSGVKEMTYMSWQSRVVWMCLIAFSLLVTLGWIYQAMQRPFTAFSVLLLLFALLWYWSTEDASLAHQHSEFEVVFWSVIAFFCGVILFMLPDSPIRDLLPAASSLDSRGVAGVADEEESSKWWSLILAIFVAYAVLNVVRAKHREELKNKPEVFLRRLSSSLLALSPPEKKVTVKQVLTQLEEALNQLDHDYLPGNIARFISYSKKLIYEAKIVRIFKDAGRTDGSGEQTAESTAQFTPEEYSYMIMKSDLALILYRVKDHKVAAHRSQLIRILSEQPRLSLLTVATKAMVLHCLQQLKLSWNRQLMERAVLNIIMSVRGADLTELKAIIDSKGNYHSLHKLVFNDIKTAPIRKLITEHMLNEAKLVKASLSGTASGGAGGGLSGASVPKSRSLPKLAGVSPPEREHQGSGTVSSGGGGGCLEYGKVSRQYVFNDGVNARRLIQAQTKIVSDVDDTFVCSGGTYPAGVDRRYGRKSVYPGVGTFYRELDLSGGEQSGETIVGEDRDYLGNLVFLSARPHIYKDVVEAHEYQKYRVWKRQGVLHCIPTLLPGSLVEGSEFVLRGKLEALAEKKMTNLKEYALLYPEYSYIFVGDNGQADVRAVAKILDLPFINIKCAYIHHVLIDGPTFGLPVDDDYKMSKIFFFTNYVQAALHAFKNDWLSASGLCRVAIATVNEFDLLADAGLTGTAELRNNTQQDIVNSINEVLAYLDFVTKKPQHKIPPHILEAVNQLLPNIKLPKGALAPIASPTIH